MADIPTPNYGVLFGQRPEDYVAGASPIQYEERNSAANWKDFCPPGEWQGSNRGDSMSCVTFSALNSIEAQEKFLTGKQINYSDRWIAKMSETMRTGNYLYKVADAIRKYGLVLEEDYPTPASFTWDEYHAPIAEPLLTELKKKGQQWLRKWQVQYEWLAVGDWNIDYHLKHAPIQLALYEPSHAVVDVYSPSDAQEYFDSYQPWLKTTPISNIHSALKLILTKHMSNAKLIQVGTELGYWMPATSPDGLKSMALNFGEVLPEKADGSIDFDKLTPDGKL